MAGLGNVCCLSVSMYATMEWTNYISQPSDGVLDCLAKKIVGSLTYAGLFIASLVEAVARLILGVAAFIGNPTDCSDSEYHFFVTGAYFSAINGLIAGAAIFNHLCRDKMTYEDINPCATNLILDWAKAQAGGAYGGYDIPAADEPYTADKRAKDCALLEVDAAATDPEIRKAYKKKATQFHPDRNQGNEKWAEEQFKVVLEAYHRLIPPGKPEQR